MEDSIEIRLRGEGIKPGLVRSHELAEILAAVEDMVIAESLKRDPGLKKEDIVVGLYEIADESVGLRFRSSVAAIAIPAFAAASQAVALGHFEEISPQSLKPLQVLSSFAKRHNAVAELKVRGESTPIAEITSSTVIPQEPKIFGATEVSAKVLRVGGKLPKAMIELQDGTVLYCEIPVELAIRLGHRLYETAVFSGYATWNAATLNIEEFTISDLSEYPARDPSEALSGLRQFVRAEVLEDRDVNALVAFLRRGGDAE